MGSIAVVLSSPKHAAETLSRMLEAAPHRGDRTEVTVRGDCALGIRVDDLGDAVLGTADGLSVVVAGSLDNLTTLRSELAIDPMLSNEAAVPAVVAALYHRDGEAMPAGLRGVFAGACTDGRRVFVFRDQIGHAPLFYRSEPSTFYAASEAKQVVAGAAIPREPDMDVVARMLFRNMDDDTPAALRGVHRLAKSTGLTAAPGRVEQHRYWQPETLLETERYPEDELAARFHALMEQAVGRTLTGRDVISLSGGVDSPAVAAYAAPLHLARFGRPINALTVIYPRHPSADERQYVEPLAERLGLPLHEYEQQKAGLDDVETWVRVTDSPYPAASLAHYAEDYGRARKLGFRNVLTGEHAEFVMALSWFRLEHYITHGRLRALRHEVLLRRAAGRSWRSIARQLVRSLIPDEVLAARNEVLGRRPAVVPAWIDHRLVARRGGVVPWRRWHRLQLTGFIGPGPSLEAEEICQAVTGVRSRRPWSDIDLWEFFLRMPADQKFPELRDKGLVRQLLRGRVPDEILDRRDKTVFDEAVLASSDHHTLRRLLVRPRHRLTGVDYALLEQRLESGNLSAMEFAWARNLANIHAFLAQW